MKAAVHHFDFCVVYGKAAYQEGLTLFLNCSVQRAEMDQSDPENPRIKSVTAWQQIRHALGKKASTSCFCPF